MKTTLLYTFVSSVMIFFNQQCSQARLAAQREDSRLHEEQLLRANEQITLLLERLEKAESQIADLDAKIKALQKTQQSTDMRLSQLDSRLKREKEDLLDEVANIVAESSQRTSPTLPTLRQSPPGGARFNSQNKQQNTTDNFTEYVVKSGDTLTSIARSLSAKGISTSAAKIAEANNISEATRIRVGQKLIIPKN